MILNERKIKILEAIINDYIRTAEPIGSRTIAKKYGFGISSATIRNEMSDLEEMGLIVQPHASAGRVPSDKGYRLYVDELMHRRELTSDEESFLRQLIIRNMGRIDNLMKETARALAILTNYTTVVSEPKIVRTLVRHMQFVPIDDKTILLVLVTDNKVAKNYNIRVSQTLDYKTLSLLSEIFNRLFSGKELQDILDVSESYSPEICKAANINKQTLASVWETLASALVVEDNMQVYMSGAKNILGYPEFSDLDKARAIFGALEERDLLITLLGGESIEDVSIIIGAENSLKELRNCSIIKANYAMGQQLFGSIGVIGPTRMDYAQVVSVLSSIVENLNSVLRGLDSG